MIKYRVATENGFIEFAVSFEAYSFANGNEVREIEFEHISHEILPVVSAAQLRAELLSRGVTNEAVRSGIMASGLAQEKKDELLVVWDYSTEFERHRENTISIVGAALGLPPTTLDDIWKKAGAR